MTNRTKVLFLAGTPTTSGASYVRLDEEFRAIERAIQSGTARETIELASTWDSRNHELQARLLQHRPHILHFAGHASDHLGLFLRDKDGRQAVVDRDALAGLFRALDGLIRVVVLNACESLSMVAALDDLVDYTIGMSRPISHVLAVAFAEAFYFALASGHTVAKSFDLAVSAVKLQGHVGADAARLHVRPGVDISRVLQGTPDAPPAPSPSTTSAHVTLNNVKAQDVNIVVNNSRLRNGGNT